MGLFYQATDGPPSRKQVLGAAIYVFMALISIWATSESLITSFDFPTVVGYLVGGVVVGFLAAMLSIIKGAFEQRKLGLLVFASVVFLLGWAVSLATNSHKFFTQLKLKEIRLNEVQVASNELANLSKSANSIGNTIVSSFRDSVSRHIENYVLEVKNPENCGHGDVAERLKVKVETSMPGSSFNLLSGYNKPSVWKCRELGDKMGNLMRAELNKRVDTMMAKVKGFSVCNDEAESKIIMKDLDECNSEYFNKDPNDVKTALSHAHQYYNRVYDCLNTLIMEVNSMGGKGTVLSSRTLEMPVPSIELEKISELLPYVNTHKNHQNSLWLSIAIAFVIDLGAFAILYFMVYTKEENF